jgi:hypothetical protein
MELYYVYNVNEVVHRIICVVLWQMWPVVELAFLTFDGGLRCPLCIPVGSAPDNCSRMLKDCNSTVQCFLHPLWLYERCELTSVMNIIVYRLILVDFYLAIGNSLVQVHFTTLRQLSSSYCFNLKFRCN